MHHIESMKVDIDEKLKKKTVAIHVRYAIRAVDSWLHAYAAVPNRWCHSWARLYHHVPAWTGAGIAKFALGEETLRGFQAALSEICPMDRLGHAPQNGTRRCLTILSCQYLAR